jgi:tetratricopeptide (TPR) repeat protein
MRVLIITLILLNFLTRISVHGQDDPILKKTDKLIDKDDYVEALEILNVFINKDTTKPIAYWQRSVCLRVTGDYVKAEVDLKRAILLDSTNADFYSELGVVYAITQKYDLSLKNFDKSLSIDSSKNAMAYNNRGALFFYSGDNNNEKALADYSRSIKIDPKDEYAFYNRGIVYLNLMQYQNAIDDLSTSIKLKHKQNKAYYDRGVSYYNIDEYKKAAKDFSKALKYNNIIDPFEKLDEGEIYYWRGECYEMIGKRKEAQKDKNRAEQLGYEN